MIKKIILLAIVSIFLFPATMNCGPSPNKEYKKVKLGDDIEVLIPFTGKEKKK